MDVRELVIRPSPTNQPLVWIVYTIVIVMWFGCVYLVTHPLLVGASSFATQRLFFGLYAAVVAIPVGIAIGIVSTRTASIYLTASHIGYTTFGGTLIEHKRTDLARIVLFSGRRHKGFYTPNGVLTPVISFESIRGGELFHVSSRWWGLADIHRVALACGVVVEGDWENIRDQG